MADDFRTRIPTLDEPQLWEYFNNPMKYKAEAVAAAVAELRRRGLEVPEPAWAATRAGLAQRDQARHAVQPRRAGLLHDGTRPRHGRIRLIAGAILVAGVAAAAVIYRLAATAPVAFGLAPEDSKKYLREVEVIGGKANLVATQLRQGFTGIWHGTNLAFTVLGIAVLLAGGFWLVATRGHGSD